MWWLLTNPKLHGYLTVNGASECGIPTLRRTIWMKLCSLNKERAGAHLSEPALLGLIGGWVISKRTDWMDSTRVWGAEGRGVLCWTSASRHSQQLGIKNRLWEPRKKSDSCNEVKGPRRRGARGCSQDRKWDSQSWGMDSSRGGSGANYTHHVHAEVTFLLTALSTWRGWECFSRECAELGNVLQKCQRDCISVIKDTLSGSWAGIHSGANPTQWHASSSMDTFKILFLTFQPQAKNFNTGTRAPV